MNVGVNRMWPRLNVIPNKKSQVSLDSNEKSSCECSLKRTSLKRTWFEM